jgi:hypothetical protein
MTQQTINIGTAANAKNGDPLRTAFTKINANFTELYAGGANETQLTNGAYTLTLGSNGNLTFPDATVQTTAYPGNSLIIAPINYITVDTSSTYALSTTITDNMLLVTGGGTVATLTFPSTGLIDGQRLRFTVNGTYSISLLLTAGPTLIGTFSGMATTSPPTTFSYVYRASNTSWYRI